MTLLALLRRLYNVRYVTSVARRFRVDIKDSAQKK